MDNRIWAKSFRGTGIEFIKQAKKRNLSNKSIQYWVKYNWNLNIKLKEIK